LEAVGRQPTTVTEKLSAGADDLSCRGIVGSEAFADGVVKRQWPQRDNVTGARGAGSIMQGLTVCPRRQRPVTSDDATLTAAIQDGMNGDDGAVLENANPVGGAVHFDRSPTRAVRHALEIAVDRDHAVTGDASLKAQHGLERPRRQRMKRRALLGEVLGDNAPGDEEIAAIARHEHVPEIVALGLGWALHEALEGMRQIQRMIYENLSAKRTLLMGTISGASSEESRAGLPAEAPRRVVTIVMTCSTVGEYQELPMATLTQLPHRCISDSRNAAENSDVPGPPLICGAKNRGPREGHLVLTGSTLMCWRPSPTKAVRTAGRRKSR
jgi:hypothetical protein